MNSHKRIEVGALVVVVRVINPQFQFLVGHVGEVTEKITGWEAALSCGEWVVLLPTLNGQRCPHCGEAHTPAEFCFMTNELKLLDDPDQGLTSEEGVAEDKPWTLVTS